MIIGRRLLDRFAVVRRRRCLSMVPLYLLLLARWPIDTHRARLSGRS